MRLTWFASAVLFFSAIPYDASAAARSNPSAITLVAHVAAVFRLHAETPTTTNATAKLLNMDSNAFMMEFSVTGEEGALIQIPVVMRTNAKDFLLRAIFAGPEGGYIWMEGDQPLGSVLISRPMRVGPRVTFAVASGLANNSGISVGAMLPGTIKMMLPPGAASQGQRIAVQITMEALKN